MIKQKLQDEQLKALKAGNKEKLSVLRYILAQFKNKEIEKNPPTGGELSEDEAVVVLKKIAKELKESIDAFAKANRPELVKEYQAQLDIVAPYLPKEISDEELEREIRRIVDANKTLPNPKAIIGICMRELKTKADPARIMKLLNAILGYETD